MFRIAMTVTRNGSHIGILGTVTEEKEIDDGEHDIVLTVKTGKLHGNIKIGPNLSSAKPLPQMDNLSNPGVKLHGAGFIVTHQYAKQLLKPSKPGCPSIIHDYRNGRDLAAKPREVQVIDAFGLTVEELADRHPAIYQHLLNTVKPERDNNKRESRKEFWWLFGEPNKKLRKQLYGLDRYIATVETSKHRFFTFLDQSILPDNMLVNIAVRDADLLGVLSSGVHVCWALACGGTLEDRPHYNKTRCFETYPFPDIPEGEIKTRIRDLGERLDAHRKARQAEHADLTLTGMYNVLEKLRKEEPLTDKDKAIHDQGLVTLLKQIHDDLDAAVLEAYGWQDLQTTTPLADRLARGDEDLEQAILQRLVDLNHERAAEEARGHIRYLRPEFQDPDHGKKVAQAQQDKLALPKEKQATPVIADKLAWPKTTVERVATLKSLLQTLPPDPEFLSPALKGNNTPKRRADIQDLLDTLGQLEVFQLKNAS